MAYLHTSFVVCAWPYGNELCDANLPSRRQGRERRFSVLRSLRDLPCFTGVRHGQTFSRS